MLVNVLVFGIALFLGGGLLGFLLGALVVGNRAFQEGYRQGRDQRGPP